jgi:hypothetical protein
VVAVSVADTHMLCHMYAFVICYHVCVHCRNGTKLVDTCAVSTTSEITPCSHLLCNSCLAAFFHIHHLLHLHYALLPHTATVILPMLITITAVTVIAYMTTMVYIRVHKELWIHVL